MRNGTFQHPAIRDTLLALLVLGLTFLNFGHTNIAFAAGGRLVVTTTSVCGNPFLPASGDHAPCHACRNDIFADLPPPAPVVVPVVFVSAAVVHVELPPPAGPQPVLISVQARAPPLRA